MNRGLHTSAIAGLLLVTACGTDSKNSTDSEPTVSTVPATTPATVPATDAPTTTAAPVASEAQLLVEALAADAMEGRENLSDGSVRAQEFLIGEISEFAQPVFAGEGNEGYLQHFAEGANILGLIPGGDLADEYVIIGAHYDHLGTDCDTTDAADQICNGAADNAGGVAAAIMSAKAIAAEGTPRRSVVIALWDAEEDGLLGSKAYLADPTFPVEFTVAYLNFDIQGANLSPAMANTTVVVGAETGGAALIEFTQQAIAQSSLESLQLSAIFGQGRSDYFNFQGAGVPVVFFTDANNGCYHTAQDDVLAFNFKKLDQQVINATALATALASTDSPPTFVPDTPLASYNDAVSMLAVIERGLPDVGLLSPDAGATYEQYRLDLHAIVDAGEDGFNDEALQILLLGAIGVVSALTETACLAST